MTNLNEVLAGIVDSITGTSSTTLSSEVFSSLAANLPDGFVITASYAAEIGLPILDFIGVEGTYTTVYSPDGSTNTLFSAGGTLGTPSGVPVEAVFELGVAFVGETGIEALEEFSFTSEGGIVTGIGATVPLNGAVGDISDLIAASATGDLGFYPSPRYSYRQ